MAKRELGSRVSAVVKIILFLAAIYNIYILAFAVYDVYQHMMINLLYALPLTYIMYSSSKRSVSKIPWYDYVLAITSLVVVTVLLMNFRSWFWGRLWLVTPVTTEQFIVGMFLIVLLLEAVRRVGGIFITAVASVFLVFLLLAPYIPVVGFRTTPQRVVEFLCLTP